MIDTQTVDWELSQFHPDVPPITEGELFEVAEMASAQIQFGVIDETVSPEIYARINITKNTKGYSSETTVSVRGVMSEEQFRMALRATNRIAREETLAEIANREAIDRGEHVQAEQVATRVETAHSAETIDELPF